jgi:hypothetical protein
MLANGRFSHAFSATHGDFSKIPPAPCRKSFAVSLLRMRRRRDVPVVAAAELPAAINGGALISADVLVRDVDMHAN